ncbi:metal ABC transporter permease [Candidatus Methylacidithermus pantelleriae]|nr:metal ABC transporter permease [Candidatus Methylacidithermus pantelleriae]
MQAVGWDVGQLGVAFLIGATCALLGVFVTTRGMAFLADAIAHAALAGVAVGLVVQRWVFGQGGEERSWILQIFFVSFCLGLAFLVQWLVEKTDLRPDTVIAFCFTGSVALGVTVLHRVAGPETLEKWLFGAIEQTDWKDQVICWILSVASFWGVLRWLGPLTLSALNQELAIADGIPARRVDRLLALGVGLVIGITLRMAGALLVTALLVIPASTARLLARSFRVTLVGSVLIGSLATLVGAWVSQKTNLPTGAVIVLLQVGLLVGSLILRELNQWRIRLGDPTLSG